MKSIERSFPERLLNGVSVIMIIFGILETIVFLLAAGALLLANSATAKLFSGTRDIAAACVFLAAAITELIAGKLGRKLVNQIGSKPACVVFGLLCAALTIASIFLLGRPIDLLTALTLGVCLILPAVYLLTLSRIPADN